MSYSRTRVLPTLLAAVLLIGAANLGAYAASGKPLLLGKTNKATKTTTVKMKGNGAALSLKTKANSAPLKINSKVKVGNLNADRLDGLDSSALETLTYTFPLSGTTLNTKMTFALPGLRPGIYLATYAVTAQVYGAGGTLVCDFDNGQAEQVINNNFVSGGGRVFVSAAGVLDARTSTYVFECVTDGTHFDVPSPAGPASVHLTRIDKTINTPTTGVGS